MFFFLQRGTPARTRRRATRAPRRWIPDKLAPRERGLCCTNVIMADPEHGTLLPVCGWHRTACVLTHQPDNDPASKPVTIPNADGLCVSHSGRENGRFKFASTRVFRARASRRTWPRVESAPRDDRSSPNQPKRVEIGRARSL